MGSDTLAAHRKAGPGRYGRMVWSTHKTCEQDCRGCNGSVGWRTRHYEGQGAGAQRKHGRVRWRPGETGAEANRGWQLGMGRDALAAYWQTDRSRHGGLDRRAHKTCEQNYCGFNGGVGRTPQFREAQTPGVRGGDGTVQRKSDETDWQKSNRGHGQFRGDALA